jgi:hypothetical protein
VPVDPCQLVLCFSAMRLVVIQLTDLFRVVVQSLFLAERSKDKVCGRSLVGIAGSNPSGRMDVCLLYCVLSGRGLCDQPIPRAEEFY